MQVCIFTNSGSEANELALVLARLYTKAFDAISFRNSYHGGSPYTIGLTAHGTWKHGYANGWVLISLADDVERWAEARSPWHRCSQYFWLWGRGEGPNHKSHAMTSSEILERGTFVEQRYLLIKRSEVVACVLARNQDFAIERGLKPRQKCDCLNWETYWVKLSNSNRSQTWIWGRSPQSPEAIGSGSEAPSS